MATNEKPYLNEDANGKFLLTKHKGGSFSVRRSAAQSITNGSVVKVAFDTEDFDTDGWFDSTTNNEFKPTVAGKYLVSASVWIEDAVTDATTMTIRIYVNGAEKRTKTFRNSGTVAPTMSISEVLNLAANDTVDIRVNHGEGSAKNASGDSRYTWFSGAFLHL